MSIPFARRRASSSLRRRLVSLSPLVATAILTAAIFLLPATGDSQRAAASVDDITVSAIHSGNAIVAAHGAVRN